MKMRYDALEVVAASAAVAMATLRERKTTVACVSLGRVCGLEDVL